MCTLYSRHNLRHEDIFMHRGSCFHGTRTADFYKLGLFKCSRSMWTFSMLHFHFKERSFDFHSKGGDIPKLSPRLIPWPFQASLVIPSGGVWLLQKCEDLPSSSDFGVICNHPESFQVQVPDHHHTQSVANGVDSRNTHCSPALPLILLLHTQCSGQGLDCPLGLMWNGKKGSPPPTDPPPPLLTALWRETVPETRIRQSREAQMIVLEMKELSSWLRWHQGERLLFLSAPLLLSSWTP